MASIPITIVTGFLGSGKTTILLNLIPQLPSNYRLAILKNEFGDLAVDSELAAANSVSGVRELLNGCICCNLVGQLSDALNQLRDEVNPDRIVIETSGSAFPATLAMEVNRLAREQNGDFVLDGVISVIDVENWQGYDDTSYTAKLQARYTDLIIFNKWESVPEERFDICLDRVGDLEVETAWVKSTKGKVDKDVLLGIDGALLSKEIQSGYGCSSLDGDKSNGVDDSHHHREHNHVEDHQSEVEVLSASLTATSPSAVANLPQLMNFLLSAPKDEVYRIKGIVRCSTDQPPENSSGDRAPAPNPQELPPPPSSSSLPSSHTKEQNYIVNWAFGRWTFTPCPTITTTALESNGNKGTETGAGAGAKSQLLNVIRITVILARGESAKWQRKLENDQLLGIADSNKKGDEIKSTLSVQRIS